MIRKGVFLSLNIFFILSFNALKCQTLELSGKVTDSLQEKLTNANVIAYPLVSKVKSKFSITNNLGEYKIALRKNIEYRIEISFIGYEKFIFNFKADSNQTKNIVLLESIQQLDEVEVTYKIPIQIKKDTIVYETDAFTDGSERKLREVLKKLPGIEVDRAGNVTATGKKVTKILVEDKLFFTGDSKLAVNNIPADVIAQVEVLDDYNEVGFLKGLRDSDDVALNILLKEDKKKFAFGDIQVGAGIEKRYLLHPTAFYYSPKTSVNFIGDFNNIGIKSFTLSDYIEFEGGFGKLINNVQSYANLVSNDFAQFIQNRDFKENTNRFSALNLVKSLSTKTDLTAYVIWNDEDTETEQISLNTFNSDSNPFEEQRTSTNSLDNIFVIGKANITVEPSKTANLTFNSFVKLTDNTSNGILLTNTALQNNTFNTLKELESITLKQNSTYSKRFSKVQTLSLEGTLSFNKSTTLNKWITDTPFLNNLIPLQNEATINVNQNTKIQRTDINVVGKDYWVLNNFNHIYTSLGVNLLNEDFISSEQQLLENGNINDFASANFGNDLNYQLNDFFAGLEYKFLTGIITVKSGLFYHNYQWKSAQLGSALTNKTDAILPQLNLEVDFGNTEKLRFKYQSNIRFPTANRLFENFLLSSFNSVRLGNPNLFNERFNTYSLNYSKYSLLRGLQLAAGLSYNQKTQSIKNATNLDGIEQFTTFMLINQPENSISANFRYGKKLGDFKYSFETRGSYREFFQLVNDNITRNISKNLSATTKVKTNFDNLPNIELSYKYEPSSFRTNLAINNFRNAKYSANLDFYFLNNFHFMADYSRIDFLNSSQNIRNKFDVADASLFYQKEDSPWNFELKASNLFNTQFNRQSSFSDFLISDQSTFIMPRIIMFTIGYKI